MLLSQLATYLSGGSRVSELPLHPQSVNRGGDESGWLVAGCGPCQELVRVATGKEHPHAGTVARRCALQKNATRACVSCETYAQKNLKKSAHWGR